MADAQLNNPNYPLPFFMADASDRAKGVPGLNPLPRPRVAKNGGAFAPAMGQVINQGFGWYALLGHPADRNMLGSLIVGGDVDDPDVVCVEGVHTVRDFDPYAAQDSAAVDLSEAIALLNQLVALKQTSNAYDLSLTNSTVPKQERFPWPSPSPPPI